MIPEAVRSAALPEHSSSIVHTYDAAHPTSDSTPLRLTIAHREASQAALLVKARREFRKLVKLAFGDVLGGVAGFGVIEFVEVRHVERILEGWFVRRLDLLCGERLPARQRARDEMATWLRS